MGYLDWLEAYQKGKQGQPVSPSDPNAAANQQGLNEYWEERERLQESTERTPPPRPLGPPGAGGVGEYFETLIGAPIAFAVIGGVVALLVGGDFVTAAVISGAVTFALILLYGVIKVTIQLLPLLIVIAIVIYALGRFGVGPGLHF